MFEEICGVIVKTVGGVFEVEADGVKYTCFSPKKLRYDENEVLVGDNVKFVALPKGKGNITAILPRKNRLKRPEVANVDVCFVVLASIPQPDFYLVDKVLINCFQEKIEPVIVVNKIDLGGDIADEIRCNFGSVCDIVCVSAFDLESVKCLEKYVDGKTVCFAGQSAVGKTSLLNAILPSFRGEIGGVSEKSGRGKHTTRHSSLHKVWNGFVVDTCGFSLCDLADIRSDELRLYLDDFVTVACDCKFSSCTHTVEPNCAVKRAVENGKLCRARYERYLAEYAELVDAEVHKY